MYIILGLGNNDKELGTGWGVLIAIYLHGILANMRFIYAQGMPL